MKNRYLLLALTLAMPANAYANAPEPAPAPKQECCCKKDEKGKMACCKDKAETAKADHSAHETGGKAP